ncbi:MAG: SpoIIE family protein phosphatase [Chloroflexota bacterium]|nr:SpoIIE family protein phosphatase [Chloroflexota bacterium]
MPVDSPSWRIVRYDGDAPERLLRIRDETRVQAVVRHLLALECVALVGPPLSQKTALLADIIGELENLAYFRALYVNLWRTRSNDEATFFTSVGELISQGLGIAVDPPTGRIDNARAFQNFLEGCLNRQDRHLALMIDHLQALPHDLVHSLLLALRATYMERSEDAPTRLVAVVSGSMNLVGLSSGPTSPFNIAKPVVAAEIDRVQSRALAEATLSAHHCQVSPAALDRIVELVGGDRYLLPMLCAWSADAVQSHRVPKVTRSVVDRSVRRLWQVRDSQTPIREAIRLIEEDPDTLLDVLDILDNGPLPRSRSRQMVSRTGTDRLRLSGAILLSDGHYAIKNRVYREALASHFTADRVGHILRIAGRWDEAIDYLTPRMAAHLPDLPRTLTALTGSSLASTPASLGLRPDGRPLAKRELLQEAQPVRGHGARPQLLEAIVQSIYATDTLAQGFAMLARGLQAGFSLDQVDIYRVKASHGVLERVYPPLTGDEAPVTIDLHDRDGVEARMVQYGNYALRGSRDEARLVVALMAQERPIGLVTVDRFVENRDLHQAPADLPELLRFTTHASVALQNVTVRAAYRQIGQAVLSAGTVEPTLNLVLEAVSEALGCEFATLYALDPGNLGLEMVAGVGRLWSRDWQEMACFARTSDHPAVSSLRDQRLIIMRGTDRRLDSAIVGRFGLHDHMRVFLPLQAGGQQLGTLEVGYSKVFKTALNQEGRRTLSAFADQVAIAVHNMQLLQRTDEALARRVDELEKLRSSSLAVSSTLDLDAVLSRILTDVQALFPHTETTVWGYDPETEQLTVLQSSLTDRTYLEQQLGHNSVTGQAVVTRRPQAHHDSASMADGANPDPEAALGLQDMVVVPLISHDRVLGTINLYTYTASPPVGKESVEGVLTAFAAQAAVAIDNARLHQEELARQRLEEELAVARQIQRSMLPKRVPFVPGWSFADFYQAARIVGGDFYDFYDLPGKPARLGMLIADVADKGVPAALFMALSRTILRSTALSGRGPEAALLRANDLILEDSESDLFLSAFYGVLDLAKGRMQYVNAGHNPPLWYRATQGDMVELRGKGIVLGVFEDISLEERRVDLASGDVVVFYTDGVTEALSADGEFFGQERLEAVVGASAAGSAQEVLQAITGALYDFAGDTEQFDDITCFVLKRE